MAYKTARELAEELLHADFPTVLGLDKYDLRKWLVGHAYLKGWAWQQESPRSLVGTLTQREVTITCEVIGEGLRLSCGVRSVIVATDA